MTNALPPALRSLWVGPYVLVAFGLFGCAPLDNGILPTARPTIGERAVTTHLYVANAQGNTVTVYGPGDAPIRTIKKRVSNPFAMALDSAGNLFVANNMVTAYRRDATTVLRQISKGVDSPYGLAFDTAGTLYVANTPVVEGSCPCGSVTAYANGRNKLTRTILSGGPSAIALDAARDLYVAERVSNDVKVYAPGSSTPTRTLTKGISGPTALALDSHGNLYVANDGPNRGSVAVYGKDHTAPVRVITDDIRSPTAVLVDRSGSVYVANAGGANTVTVYSPSSQSPIRTVSSGVATPWALLVDPGGNLYVANLRTGTGATPNGSVSVYRPNATAPYRTITNGIDDPHALAFGP